MKRRASAKRPAPSRAATARRPTRPAAQTRSKSAAATNRRSTEGGGSADQSLPELPFPLTNLDKVFFPKEGYTKGDLLNYYARIAPQILPVMRDRPLALKRYPDGVGGQFFFQQNAPAADSLPAGVRVAPVRVELDGAPHPRVIGGTVATLLYTIQLGCIGVDPWHARINSLQSPDYTIIDLDPGEAVPFARIVEVALWVKSVLDEAGLHGIAKTSGSRGIHIYVPLPARASDEMAVAVAHAIATRVANAHPREATVIRDLQRRGTETVYLDYLQNARGKTMAAAYCVRAVDDARVSMPLEWSELTPKLDQHAFTLRTAPERVARVGDIWAAAMKQRNTGAAVREFLGKPRGG